MVVRHWVGCPSATLALRVLILPWPPAALTECGCGGTSPWLMQIHKYVMDMSSNLQLCCMAIPFFNSFCPSAGLLKFSGFTRPQFTCFTNRLTTQCPYPRPTLFTPYWVAPPMTHRRGHIKGTSKGACGRFRVCAVCSEDALKNWRVSAE